MACVIPVASTGSEARRAGETASSSARRSAAAPARIASTWRRWVGLRLGRGHALHGSQEKACSPIVASSARAPASGELGAAV